jgi:UPF0755 protein
MTQIDAPDEYVLLPRGRAGRRRILSSVIAVAALVGILAAAGLLWATRQITPSSPPGDLIEAVVIPSGATLDQVGDILEEEGVIGSARVFRWYTRWKSVDAPQAGTYVRFRENSPMADAVDVLAAGPIPASATALTIIPGMWLDDALARINSTFPEISVDELRLVLASGQITSRYRPADATSWEGYLLPETYEFAEGSNSADILQTLVDQFDATLDELGYDQAEIRTGYSASDLVTIASMIERETGDPPEERGKIARVVFTRLDKGIPLGIDATILYGLGRKGGDGEGLTATELKTDTPYNSRLNTGLPPTPISLPSKSSLEGAINPATGNWEYYVLVSSSPREHLFTDNYDEFLDAKKSAADAGVI